MPTFPILKPIFPIFKTNISTFQTNLSTSTGLTSRNFSKKVEILVLESGNIGFKNQKFWDGGRYFVIKLKLNNY
jgi:hypothetical protein